MARDLPRLTGESFLYGETDAPLFHPSVRGFLSLPPNIREDDPFIFRNSTAIGPQYVRILKWMLNDLESYLADFDRLFLLKLERIRQHQQQRIQDRDIWLRPLQSALTQNPDDVQLRAEIERLHKELKPHGFVQDYNSANDFIAKFVAPSGNLLAQKPTTQERILMNRPGKKELFVDTWGVPFFNSGTQTIDEAREGLKKAIVEFKKLNLQNNISFQKFSELVSLFLRPEFDDVRRYKLRPPMIRRNKEPFLYERSDVAEVARQFPQEVFLYLIDPIDLDMLSFTFGQRIHLVGLISHISNQEFADGRIFTGPADFAEHDPSHAFFNLRPNFPGSPSQWRAIHQKFYQMKMAQSDPGMRFMMSLVYFHFTHESGYKTLLPTGHRFGPHIARFDDLIDDIREKIKIRYYYDWLLKQPEIQGQAEFYLSRAFFMVGRFFKTEFSRLLRVDPRFQAQSIGIGSCIRNMTKNQ